MKCSIISVGQCIWGSVQSLVVHSNSHNPVLMRVIDDSNTLWFSPLDVRLGVASKGTPHQSSTGPFLFGGIRAGSTLDHNRVGLYR